MATKPLQYAFIGTGMISHAHAKGLALLGKDVEFVAACDPNAASLEKFQAAWGKHIRTYKTCAAMLRAEKKIDAASVCTPNGMHRDPTIAALKAGVHVIVEKPMAMNAKDARAMQDAAIKAKRHLTIGFQWRFDSRSQMIRKQVDAGEFGKILYVRVQALRRRGIPNWGVFGQKKLQGGGPMIDIGVHCAEMAHFMMGSPKPISANGACWTYMGDKPMKAACMWPNWDYKTYTVEDLAVGNVRFANGAMMSIEASFCAHIEKDIWNVTIMGEKGGATWETGMVHKDQDGYMWNMTPAHLNKAGPEGDWTHVQNLKMKNFIECIRDKKPDIADGEHGVMVQQILDGIYASAKAGKEVKIK
ncbi:MAG: Gfo/Idh/MocA family oxidoreductase [Planctomycetota bacterium]